MTRRQGTGFRPFGGDWFGRCAGWHAAAMRGRYVTHAEARVEQGEPIAEVIETARAAVALGKIVVCQRRADGVIRCSVITREAAAQLVLDLQMALTQ